MSLRWFPACLLLTFAVLLRAEESSPPAEAAIESEPTRPPVSSVLAAQVELHRRGFSCGSIDGVSGAQTAGALKAFQRNVGISETGQLDSATREHLRLTAPAVENYMVTPVDLGSIHPVPTTWVEKSQVEHLDYASLVELVAERFHAHPNLIRKLNPTVDWSSMFPGTSVVVPAVDTVVVDGDADSIVITLSTRELEVFDGNSRVIAHFPVSIARMVEKRPLGELTVKVVIPDPDYTFDPAVFPESAEAKTLKSKLIIPPGPNNPVGKAWIGLDRPGYGIHGTPDPENVGRTESHGCFRLANWDAVTLLRLARVGMHVEVEP